MTLLGVLTIAIVPVAIVVRGWAVSVRHMGDLTRIRGSPVGFAGIAGNVLSAGLASGLGYATFAVTRDRPLEFGVTVLVAVCAFFVMGASAYGSMLRPRAREADKLKIHLVLMLVSSAVATVALIVALVQTGSQQLAFAHDLNVALFFAAIPLLLIEAYRVRARFVLATRDATYANPGSRIDPLGASTDIAS